MVVPGKFQNSRSPKNDCRGKCRAFEFLDHDIKWQCDKSNLPDNSNRDIEHVAREVFVALEAGILSQHHLENRAPESPWPYAPIEVHQNGVVFRLGQKRA